MIRAYLANDQTVWNLNLGCLAAAYRATPNETTKMTPNLIMLGREVRLPAEIAYGSTTTNLEQVCSYGQYVEKLKKNMHHAQTICREHLQQSAKRHTDIHILEKSFYTYKPGDTVWYLNTTRKRQFVCSKLQMPYTEPFLIQKKLSDQNYMIQFSKSLTDVKVVHHDKLKPYKGSSVPKWKVQ